MTTKGKGRNGGDRATFKAYDDDYCIKPSRIKRRQKRDWERGRK